MLRILIKFTGHVLTNESFVSIGCPGRPFIAAHPRLDDLLPVNDATFDLGVRSLGVLPLLLNSMTRSVFCFVAADAVTRRLNSTISPLSRLRKQGT